MRHRNIEEYNDDVNDIYEFLKAFPNVTMRYLVAPSKPLTSALGIINFDNKTNTWGMQMKGRVDGENAVKDGEGMMQKKLLEYQNNATIRAQYPKVGDFVH